VREVTSREQEERNEDRTMIEEKKKKKIPAIEIEGETCAKPLLRKKRVFSSNGKSMWYVEKKKKKPKG